MLTKASEKKKTYTHTEVLGQRPGFLRVEIPDVPARAGTAVRSGAQVIYKRSSNWWMAGQGAGWLCQSC